MSTMCPKCQKIFTDERALAIHDKRKHNFDAAKLRDAAMKQHGTKIRCEDESIRRRFFELNFPCAYVTVDIKKFNFFMEHVSHIRTPVVTDVDLYSREYAEWRKSNPQSKYTIETCRIIALGDESTAQKLYAEKVKTANPFAGHGSELSPFSREFVGYKGCGKKEASKRYDAHIENQKEGRRNGKPASNTIAYYTSRGYSAEQAKCMLSERQRTFTLEKCISRHGEEAGTRMYEERQRKWKAKLDAKSLEERARINEAKTHNGNGCISKIEKELGTRLNLTKDQCNSVRLRHNNLKHFKYDFCVGNKILEFNGDYWHCNPQKYAPTYFHKKLKMTASEKWAQDAEKIRLAEENGYLVKVIWESEYKKDKDAVIDECRKFLRDC